MSMDTRPEHLISVPLDKCYRLLNHGPTVLISAAHAGQRNAMTAAWNMALDFAPPKVAVVIDKQTATRPLVEQSGRFALGVPTRAIAALTLALGKTTAHDFAPDPVHDKLAAYQVELFQGEDATLPLIKGCAAWLECRLIAEPHNQQAYDLFIGEVTAAWADSRVFDGGHWRYNADTPIELQTLHYVAGNHFLSVGESFDTMPAQPITQT